MCFWSGDGGGGSLAGGGVGCGVIIKYWLVVVVLEEEVMGGRVVSGEKGSRDGILDEEGVEAWGLGLGVLGLVGSWG